mmetsp:Transcript_95528/g.274039  ORF Transcript_95528/g.274039 Transcript_95528/m.274039 type:complete len:289 (-) Transcript_95528:1053-1919(-)
MSCTQPSMAAMECSADSGLACPKSASSPRLPCMWSMSKTSLPSTSLSAAVACPPPPPPLPVAGTLAPCSIEAPPPAAASAASGSTPRLSPRMPSKSSGPSGEQRSSGMRFLLNREKICCCTNSGTSAPPSSIPLFKCIHCSLVMLLPLKPSASPCMNQWSITVENMSWESTSELAKYWIKPRPAKSPPPSTDDFCTSTAPSFMSDRCFLHHTTATLCTNRWIFSRSLGSLKARNAKVKAVITLVCTKAKESRTPKRIKWQTESASPRKTPALCRSTSWARSTAFMAPV